MRTSSLLTPLIAAGALLIPTAAWAQGAEGEAEAAPPAEAPAAEAAPVETAQAEEAAPEAAPPPPPPAEEPMAEPMAEPAPAAEAPPPAEEPAEEEGGVPGWFRIDSDALTLQLWAGATHDVGGVGIASDIYVTSGLFGEFDIGVEIPIGDPVLLIPMVGIGFDWGAKKPTTLIAPQLFGYFDFDPVYIEWWSQFFINSVFNNEDRASGEIDDMGNLVQTSDGEFIGNQWYNRLFVLFNVSENFSIGPQVEATIGLNDAGKIPDENGDLKALVSLPVGGQVSLGYGENNTLALFLGYETVKEARNVTYDFSDDDPASTDKENGIVGRFTFVRTW